MFVSLNQLKKKKINVHIVVLESFARQMLNNIIFAFGIVTRYSIYKAIMYIRRAYMCITACAVPDYKYGNLAI